MQIIPVCAEFDAISAIVFCLIELLIRTLHYLLWRCRGIAKTGNNPNADCHHAGNLRTGMGNTPLQNCLANILGQTQRPQNIRFGQKADELLPSITRGQICGTVETLGNSLRNQLKACVTLHMAVGVVEIFEKIYVQHDERKCCPRADMAVAFIGKHGVKMPPVGNFCQTVLVGHQLELAVGFRQGDLCKFALGNILMRHHNHARAITAKGINPAQKPAFLLW